jgi:hypothetical protein
MIKKYALSVVVMIFLAMSIGCSSAESDWDSQLMPRSDEKANPNPNANGNDAFLVRKPMPLGTKTSADFFFTRCDQTNQGSYYSKTSYDCGAGR